MFTTYCIKQDGAVTYVGHTNDLKQRMRQHRFNGRTGDFVVLGEYSTRQEAIEAERVAIAAHRATVSNVRERYYTGVSAKSIILNR